MKQKIYNKIKGRKPEIWVDLTADPKIKKMYKISNYGRIKNNKGKILRPDMDKDGYIKFTLQSITGKKIKRFSHRLVGMQFIPNPFNKPEINHKRVINKIYHNRYEVETYYRVNKIDKCFKSTYIFNEEQIEMLINVYLEEFNLEKTIYYK